MTHSAEIYFYVDVEFDGKLDPIINPLKNRGHRIIVGRDLDELLLLLEISDPSVVFCALSSDKATLDAPFQKLASRALEQKTPIVVLGPHDPRDGLTLYTPKGNNYDISHIPFTTLADTVALLNQSPTESAISETKNQTDPSTGETPEEQMETGDQEAANESNIQDQFAPKHRQSPESLFPIPDKKSQYRGEISGPITLTRDDGPGKKKPEERLTSSLSLHIVLAALVVLCICLALFFAMKPSAQLPKQLTVKGQGTASENSPRQSSKTLSLDRALMDGKARDGKGADQSPKEKGPEESLTDDAQKETLSVWPKQMLESALPFPGTFRPQTSKFWFQQEWEVRRFKEMLKHLPESSSLRVIGYATEKELEVGDENLELSRAWAVERFLLREGISQKRISVARGGRFYKKSDLDGQGHPRNRFVEIVVEALD